jgi:hypothetical protein
MNERELRDQVEEALGRKLSEAEWQPFRQRLRSAESIPSARAGRGHAIARATRGFVGFAIKSLVAGSMIGGLLVGLAWAYGLEQEEETSTVGGFFLTALVIGLLFTWQAPPVKNWSPGLVVFVGLTFFGAVVALVIGAIWRAAAG